MPTWRARLNRQRKTGLAFLVLTLIYAGSMVWVQQGRLASCRRTYEGVRQVFQPFLTPPPKPAAGKRYRDYVKFNNRIDELKGQCSGQVKLWWPGG